MVARGWSPSERTRIGSYLVVGLLLTLNPLFVGAFDIDGPRHGHWASAHWSVSPCWPTATGSASNAGPAIDTIYLTAV